MPERNDGLKCITPLGMDANKVAHDATPSGRDPARRQEHPDSHTGLRRNDALKYCRRFRRNVNAPPERPPASGRSDALK